MASKTFAAFIWSVAFLGGPALFIALFINPFTTWIACLLFVRAKFDKTPYIGGYQNGIMKKASNWYRGLAIWKQFRKYFPSNIVVKGKLDKNSKYLFSYHPHGILGVGVFSQFVYDYPHLKELPKIRPVTLNLVFSIPFLRTLALLSGIISCEYESLKHVLMGKHLKRGDPPESLLLVTGGAHEAQFTRPGTLTVAVNNKSGFIRLCMETNTKLVPVIAFGENDAFYIFCEEDCKNQLLKYSFKILAKVQTFLRKNFGFSLVYLYGDPAIPFLPFPFNIPILPRPVPVTVVVGDPISVPQSSNPTRQQIESVKDEFKSQISALAVEHGKPFGITTVNFE